MRSLSKIQKDKELVADVFRCQDGRSAPLTGAHYLRSTPVRSRCSHRHAHVSSIGIHGIPSFQGSSGTARTGHSEVRSCQHAGGHG